MHYTLKPSLKTVAFVKVAATLWNVYDIRSLIAEFDFSLVDREAYEEWQKIENKVAEKVAHLPQPTYLKERILRFIRPVGLQILMWIQYHNVVSYFGIKLPEEFCWTSQGTIDRRQTAMILIEDESIDVTTRFILACTYCLEDNVAKLWNEIPARSRRDFYNNKFKLTVRQRKLVYFWTCEMKGEMAKFTDLIRTRLGRTCSPYQYAFEYAAKGGNKGATQYFLEKISPREKQKSLVRIARYVADKRIDYTIVHTPRKYYSDVLCVLLTHMDKVQEEQIFQSSHLELLECFLDWPWQDLFTEAASRILELLSDQEYFHILKKICYKTTNGYKDYDYQNLFRLFWQLSLGDHKRFVIDEEDRYFEMLLILFGIKDEDSVELVLRDASFVQKERFIFGEYGTIACQELIFKDAYDLFELFIRQCLESNAGIAKFKTVFAEYLTAFYSKEQFTNESEKWHKAFRILDECADGHGKRKFEEEHDCTPAKRLR